MTLRRNVIFSALGSMALGSVLAIAQTYPNMPPGFQLPPGMQMPPNGGNAGGRREQQRRDRQRKANEQFEGARPPGVPIAMDSPAMKAFLELERHSSYRMRMGWNIADPMMAQMMTQMGMTGSETVVSNGAKLVTMHMKMPVIDVPGQVDDWEVQAVSKNGHAARKFSSTGEARYLAKIDANAAKQMEEMNRFAARSIAQSLASGPVGWASASMLAASTALSEVELVRAVKMAHEFFEWQCVKTKPQVVDRSAPPPLTDLSIAGDRTVEGTPVTSFQFFVHDPQKNEFHGPVFLHVAKDSGLPMRIEMTDPQMRGASMNIDYLDVDKVPAIEIPACLSDAN